MEQIWNLKHSKLNNFKIVSFHNLKDAYYLLTSICQLKNLHICDFCLPEREKKILH